MRDSGLMLALAKTLVEEGQGGPHADLRRLQRRDGARQADQYKAKRGHPNQHLVARRQAAGCGVCLSLRRRQQLRSRRWCDALQGALKVDQDAIRNGVNTALPEGKRVPMLQ